MNKFERKKHDLKMMDENMKFKFNKAIKKMLNLPKIKLH